MKRVLWLLLSVGLFYAAVGLAQNINDDPDVDFVFATWRGGPEPPQGVLQTYDPGIGVLPAGGGGSGINGVPSQDCGRPWDEGCMYSSTSILVEPPTTEEELELFSMFIQQMEGAFNIEIEQLDRNPNMMESLNFAARALEEHRWEGGLGCELHRMIDLYNEAGYETCVDRQYKVYQIRHPIAKHLYGPGPDVWETDPLLQYQLPYPHGDDDFIFPYNEGGYVRSRYAMWPPGGSTPNEPVNDVLLVISDTGLHWRYDDFIANLWQNLGEDVDGDGQVIVQDEEGNWDFDWGDINYRDDDGNGYEDLIGYDFVSHTPDPTHYEWEFFTHGTSVYGVAAEETYDGRHMAGTLFPGYVQVVPTKVGIGLMIDEAAAIEGIYYACYLQANGYDVVLNMSWGGKQSSGQLHYALSVFEDLGGLAVAAVGNDGDSEERYPAAYPEVLAVAASTQYNFRAWWSNFGYHCDVAAPGEAILAPYYFTPGGFEYMYYDFLDGTSFSAPITASMAAMKWTMSAAYTAESIRADIREAVYTPEDYPWDPPWLWRDAYWLPGSGPPGWGNPYYGQGLVDSYLLFELP